MDYSEKSLQLILALFQEVVDRLAGKSHTRLPSIGTCIRRINVATHPGWVSYRHNIALDEEFASLEEKVREKRLEEGRHHFFDIYLPALLDVLSDPLILPHLELLDWEDKISLPRSFFNHIALTSIQHLKLFCVTLDEELKIKLPEEFVSRGWPLRSLYLQVGKKVFATEKYSVRLLCTSILRLCSLTLESLTWEGPYFEDKENDISTESEVLRPFTSLRKLKLGHDLHFLNHPNLDALIQDNVRALEVDLDATPLRTEFF